MAKRKLSLEIDRAMREKLHGMARVTIYREKQVLNPCPAEGGGAATAGQAVHLDIHQEPARLPNERDDQIGDVSILVNRKGVKNVHLRCTRRADGCTCGSAATRLEVARAYAISTGWIRDQQSKLHNQARERRAI